MIDFQKSAVFKLTPIAVEKASQPIQKFLIESESVLSAFETVRDQLIFTNKRIIAANVQGFTGKKVDYTSIPYSKIQTFSVETAGLLGMDCADLRRSRIPMRERHACARRRMRVGTASRSRTSNSGARVLER